MDGLHPCSAGKYGVYKMTCEQALDRMKSMFAGYDLLAVTQLEQMGIGDSNYQ